MEFENVVKWYEQPEVDDSVVISARVRFARNLMKYPFPIKMSEEDAKSVEKEISEAVVSDRTPIGRMFRFYDLTNSPPDTLLSLMERHAISSQLVSKQGVKGMILNEDETVSIMINEEDHARIQSIYPGYKVESAFELANKIDDLIEENGNAEYAFDQEFGYMTSCPTNVGTGMRASLMLHLPALEASHYLGKLVPALGKFGMTVRGIHGEGSESMGSIYQLSNQITLGKTEDEILLALKSAASQIIGQEKTGLERALSVRKLDFLDKFYRSYGILKNCRRLTLKEGMTFLSDVRIGFMSGLYDMPRPKKTIYNLMMDIQPGCLMKSIGHSVGEAELDAARADYIRKEL